MVNSNEADPQSLRAKKDIFHTILFGLGGSIYTSNTLHHHKELRLDTQSAQKTALKSHAHSVHYAHKLTTTRRTLGKTSNSQGLGLEQGAACHPTGPHQFFLFPGGGDSRLFKPMCLLFLYWCKEYYCCAIFLFLFSFFCTIMPVMKQKSMTRRPKTA